MYSRGRFIALGTGAALAAASPAAAQIIPGQNQFARQITIGVSVPLSGDLAGLGQQVLNGARGAVDEANRTVGQLDRSFGIRTFDDENTIVGGIMQAQFAGDDPSVIATVGNLNASITIASLQQYANARLPVIVPASSADEITARGFRNIFRLPTKDSTEGRLFAYHLASLSPLPKKAIALTQDGDYGSDVARAFASQASNAKIPTEVLVFRETNPAYIDVARKIVSESADYVFLAGNSSTMGPILPALAAAGYKGGFGASQGFYNQETIQKYAGFLQTALFSTSMPPLDRIPAANDYLSNLRARYGEVTPLSAFGFAAAQLAINAVRRTGAADRLSLIRSLTSAGSYETLVGTFGFGPTGDPLDPNLYFYSIDVDRFKYRSAAHSSSFLI